MGNITLLELHVPDGDIQIGPKSLRSSKSETAAETKPTEPEAAAEEGGRPLGLLLVAVGIVAVLAIIATKFLGEDAADEIAGFDDEN